MRLKKLTIIMMSAVLVFGSTPLAALADDNNSDQTDAETGEYSAKDETIYGNLGAGGSLQDMYVVNTFHITEPGKIMDHGNYTNVRNLSNLTDIQQTGDNQIRLQAKDDEFYYQGDMNKRTLPWNINVTYLLDGQEVAPDELAGKDGSLEIQIETSANDSVDQVFFNNYMLQITLTLDSSVFAEIQAPDGTKANSGKDTQVTFTVMPEKEEEFILSANVTDFEMDPIDISATPASMPIEDPDLGGVKSDMQSLSDAASDIDDGVGDLNSGISDLSAGASDLSSGSADYLNGINKLDQSSGKLVNGSSDIQDALQNMNKSLQENDGAPDMSKLKKLPEELRGMAKGLHGSADGLNTLKKNYSKAYSKLDTAMGEIPDYDISQKQLKALRKSSDNPKVVKQLTETYTAARKAKKTYQAVQEAFDSVSGTLDKVSGNLQSMADGADKTASKLENNLKNMNQMDGLKELKKGISSLTSEYKTFHSGLVDYTSSVGDLAASYQDINGGIQELAGSTSDLDSGASDLKDGTEELEKETSDLPSDMQSEVDEMMDEYDASDFEPQSFVSDENKKVDVVQFVLQTESIEMEEPDTTEDTDKETKGFWGRLKDLFQ